MKNVLIVNNTGKDLTMFHSLFIACSKGEPFPEDYADMFDVKTIVENGLTKVIVAFA